MARVERVKEVVAALKRILERRGGNVSVIVGYTQSYGLYVHENLTAHHPVGQAKFLEQPAREMRLEIAQIVTNAVKRGATLLQGLLIAGLRLQRESQKLVPVDTGALKNSAFTRVEKDGSR